MSMLVFTTVTSTMEVAREALLSGHVRYDRLGRFNFRGVLAHEQTAGRGQRGNTWYSPDDESFYATYYFRHGLASPETAGEIALLAGVVIANILDEAINRYFDMDHGPRRPPGPPPIQAGLKWPNDVLLNGKKVGGILIELVQMPDRDWVALIGVGINVRMRHFPPELEGQATSFVLEGLAGRALPRSRLADIIPSGLDRMARIRRKQGLQGILRRWRAFDQTPGRRYRLQQEGVVLEGIAEGIDDSGALLLRTDAGRLLTTRSASSLKEIPPG